MSRCECVCEQQASLRYRLETLTIKNDRVFAATWHETRRCRREKRRNIEADIVAGPHLLMRRRLQLRSARSSLLCRYCPSRSRRSLRSEKDDDGINWRTTMESAHPLYINTTSHGTLALSEPRVRKGFFPWYSLRLFFSFSPFSAIGFRSSDSPRNDVGRYVISPCMRVSNVSRRCWRRHSIGAFVIKDTARDPFRASAVARLLPMLADHGAARGNREKPTVAEDLRTKPSAADSTGWNARRKPTGIGIGIGRSAGSKAIQGKRPHCPLFVPPRRRSP